MNVLQKFVNEDLTKAPFMSIFETTLKGLDFHAIISRCGYTGEDGFEISVAPENATKLCDALFEDENVAPAGLAARDSLRLEAGLCLHGNDMNTELTPIESGLMWTVRKQNISTPFIGQETLTELKAVNSK
jgi:aminomethyltransferase